MGKVRLNDDQEVVALIREGLKRTGGYCPCPLARTPENKCMQELKGFARVSLEAGESKTVSIPLDDKAFRYWNDPANCWAVEGGTYVVRVGASCEDIRLEAEVTVEGTGQSDPYAGIALPHYVGG